MVGIGSNSFRECMGITSASLPAGIQHIGEGVFRLATSLKAVNIPEGVEEIGAHTFNGCPLTTVVLPSTLKRITGTYAFRYGSIKNENAACSFIANMKRPCALDEGSIYGMEYYDLYVPKGRKEHYQSEPLWENFRSVREIGEVDEDVNDKITAKGVTLKAGENATLTVSLSTEGGDYNGYQFNLYLPEGISVATDENGNYLVREKTGRDKVALGVSDGSVLFYTTAAKGHAALANGPLMKQVRGHDLDRGQRHGGEGPGGGDARRGDCRRRGGQSGRTHHHAHLPQQQERGGHVLLRPDAAQWHRRGRGRLRAD